MSKVKAVDRARVQEELTCPVCMELLQEPISLAACNHNFCRQCVENMTSRTGNATSVTCPTCRKRTRLQATVDSMPSNRVIQSIVDSYQQSEPFQCSAHPGEHLAFFCVTCDEAICGRCGLLGAHKGHEIEDLEESLQKCEEQIGRVATAVEDLRGEHDARLQLVHNTRQDLSKQINDLMEAAMEALSEQRGAISLELREAHRKALEQANVPSLTRGLDAVLVSGWNLQFFHDLQRLVWDGSAMAVNSPGSGHAI